MKIHEKIRSMREANDWSQEEMAEKLSMSVNGYSKIERGETKSYNPKLEQIAELFGLHVLELISTDKNIYFGNDTWCHNTISSSSEMAFEIQKLQMTLQYKDEIINHKNQMLEQLKRENARLEEIIALMKNSTSSI